MGDAAEAAKYKPRCARCEYYTLTPACVTMGVRSIVVPNIHACCGCGLGERVWIGRIRSLGYGFDVQPDP
ncbi:hypothetical protein FOHLNKBM_2760 [Methylobacterium longum]|nr:hypothetical protein FOHLNKBM_2760 [Methylobacterium longum]